MFTYSHTIRFQETDAAGVVYFANVLIICHAAYEAALDEYGISLRSFFQGDDVAVPIVHANVDFKQPMFCGDHIAIGLTPQKLNDNSFEIHYQLRLASDHNPARCLAQALTRHVCIDRHQRSRRSLPDHLCGWLQALQQSEPEQKLSSELD
jgi:1,4-dihydroxy-2-naphthoyl-CoA hydrolase